MWYKIVPLYLYRTDKLKFGCIWHRSLWVTPLLLCFFGMRGIFFKSSPHVPGMMCCLIRNPS